MKRPLTTGFTLTELVVVIGIIGILAAVLTVNFNESRTTAKNRALQAEFKEVQLAIELFKAQTGDYPTTGDLGDVVPDYISELPTTADSANPSCNLRYESDGDSYKYTAENCLGGIATAQAGIQPDDELARCPSFCTTCAGETGNYAEQASFYESFAVYSQGRQCD